MSQRVFCPEKFWRRQLLFVMAWSVGLCAAVDCPASERLPETKSPTLARVFAAWKAREDRVKSFHFNWEYRVTLPKGFAFPEAPIIGGLKAVGVTIKSDGVHHTLPTSAFWGEGADRFRDDFSLVVCKGPNDWKPIERYSDTINGAKHARLKTPIGSEAPPQAAVWNEVQPEKARDQQVDARPNDWAPVMLAFRPFDRAFGWKRDRCRLVSEEELVGETRCIVIQMDELSKSERCWVEPARDYAIVRWEKRPLRLPKVAITIDYQDDKLHGWIPIRWTRHLRGATPDATGTAEAVVIRYAVNESLPKETFNPVFPPGTSVAELAVDPLVPRDAAGKKPQKPRREPVYDPFAEPLKDLEAALKAAKEQNKRVLVDFGANWCGDCHALAGVFHDNAEVSAPLKAAYVVLLVDVENETGRQLYQRCAPNRKTMAIPHLAVLDPNGDILASEMSQFAVRNYDVPKLKAFIAKWSQTK
jgi:thiol-disulfide isomerase/thioredoxin